MKTYRELYVAAREGLIEDVEKAKVNIECSPEELEDWLWQDVDPMVDKVVPDDMSGAHILNVLGQNPDIMKATVDLTSGHGTVQEILVDLLRNALYADFEPEAETIINAAVEHRRNQQASAKP